MDCLLQMTRDDPGLFVVTRSISSQLENLSCQVFQESCQVHGSSCTDAFGVIAFPEKSMNTTYGKMQSSPTGTGLALRLATFTAPRHTSVF